jgi:hypothetical protein
VCARACVSVVPEYSKPTSRRASSLQDTAGAGRRAIDPETWKECTTRSCNWFECILGAGLFAPQLRHWLSIFPRESFLLLEEEEMRTQPALVASRVSTFLRLFQPLTASAVLAASPNRSTPLLGDAVRRGLRDFYAPYASDVRQLFSELAPPDGGWMAARWLRGAVDTGAETAA